MAAAGSSPFPGGNPPGTRIMDALTGAVVYD